VEEEIRNEFIESWGSMGMLWGINRSMARIHALLMVSEKPLGLDEIASRLEISRGNTSMSLKDLRAWGVIRRVHESGERRDLYVAEADPWTVVFRIARERKRREFDPGLEAVSRALARTGDDEGEVQSRLRRMEELMLTVDRILDRLLADPGMSQTILRFLTTQVAGRKG
jgi:DNA-binding transcriptional regulator GbsR (MarR family)